MKRTLLILIKDLFWTYMPALSVVISASVFATFFPDVWGRLTLAWIVMIGIVVWMKH